MTLWLDVVAPVFRTVKVRVPPSVAVTSLTLNAGGGSLSVIVPTPRASARVAPPVGPERLSDSVSFPSLIGSSIVATVTVLLVSPGAKVKVPPAVV